MADLSIASAPSLTGATLAGNDLLPVLDVSASAGSKGSRITVGELFTGRTAVDFTANHLTLAAPAANTSLMTATGFALTESDATPMIDLAGRWNTTGAPTVIRVNITDTASATSSLFLDLQKSGATQVSLCKDGALKWGAVGSIGRVPVLFSRGIYGDVMWFQGGANNVVIGNIINFENDYITLNTSGAFGNGGVMLRGYQNAPNLLQLGQNDASTPSAQTIKAHDVTTGTGASLTLAGGKGSVAGGAVILATSSTTGTATPRLSIDSNGLTTFTTAANTGVIAATGYSLTGGNAASMIDLAGTWNTSGAPTALKVNIANTASDAASLLLDLQTSASSKFAVRAADGAVLLNGGDGNASIGRRTDVDMLMLHRVSSNAIVGVVGIGSSNFNYGLSVSGGASVLWTSDSPASSPDLILRRAQAATLQLGFNDASTAIGQTIKAHDVTTGTGGGLTLAGGKGSVAGGAVILATSATNGIAVARMTIKASGVINLSGVPTASSGLSSGDVYSNSGVLTVVP